MPPAEQHHREKEDRSKRKSDQRAQIGRARNQDDAQVRLKRSDRAAIDAASQARERNSSSAAMIAAAGEKGQLSECNVADQRAERPGKNRGSQDDRDFFRCADERQRSEHCDEHRAREHARPKLGLLFRTATAQARARAVALPVVRRTAASRRATYRRRGSTRSACQMLRPYGSAPAFAVAPAA